MLFVLPAAPKVFGGDQMVYLMNAARMLDGKAMYRDFFEFTAPGTETTYLAFFKLFGPKAWITRAVFILVGVSLTWLAIFISRKIISGPAAYFPALLFVAFPLRADLDATHHWFSVLAVMGALAVTMEERSPHRVAAAGALCGMALWYTQGRGVVAVLGFAVFLVWEWRRNRAEIRNLMSRQVSLWAAFLATAIVTNTFFIWQAGWQRFFYCTVTFGLKYYPADARWNTLQIYMAEPPGVPPLSHLPTLARWIFIHALIPMVFFFFYFRYRRARQSDRATPWDRLMLVNIVGWALLVGVMPAPAFSRLCPISIPALILLVWLVSRWRRAVCRPVALCAASALAFLWIAEPFAQQFRHYLYLDTPSGRLAYPAGSPEYEKQNWLLSRTRAGDYFLDAQWGANYFFLGLRNPAQVPYVTTSNYTRPEQVRELVESLPARRPKFVLWQLDLDMTAGDDSTGDHLAPLRDYLHANYHVARTFSDGDIVWQRND